MRTDSAVAGDADATGTDPSALIDLIRAVE